LALGLEAEANRRFEPRGLSGRIRAPEVFSRDERGRRRRLPLALPHQGLQALGRASVSRPSHRKPAGVDRAHGITVNVSNPPRNFTLAHLRAIIAKNVARIGGTARRLRP